MTIPRTIHIKGIGSASAVPDYIVITMELLVQHMEYAQAMRKGAAHQEVHRQHDAVRER